MESSILLETGTGEMEVLDFLVEEEHYGINVLKVREIVPITELAAVPGGNHALIGKMVLRGAILSVIDLKYVLKNKKTEDPTKSLGLLCEFNQTQIVFLVSNVKGIKRFNWKELASNDEVSAESLGIGSILNEDKIITLLDFESILLSLSNKTAFYHKVDAPLDLRPKRKRIPIVLADDSKVVREMLKDALSGSGYENLRFFDNGQDAYDYVMEQKQKHGIHFKTEVGLLITDIEMPKMDGYTLTRKVKSDEILCDLPVIIFSSLITDDLYYKGREVGAEAQISKPSLKRLVAIVDELIDIESC